MNKVIKKIELDLDGKVVSLTPKQAQNLKEALDELFGKEIVRKEYIPYPVTYPIYPRWEYQPSYYTTTCESNTDTGNYSFDNDILRLTG